MPGHDEQNPRNSESDISKAQSQQQPPIAGQQSGEGRQDQSETGQQSSDFSSQSPDVESRQGQTGEDTMTEQRSDIEGASLSQSQDNSGFVGSEGRQDSSSQLVEEQDFDKDGQGAPDRE